MPSTEEPLLAPSGKPLLIDATIKEEHSVVEFLLEAGEDPNMVWEGMAPLHWAARKWEDGHDPAEILPLLLQGGANPNLGALGSESDEAVGVTPLFCVAAYLRSESDEMASALITGGADPNARCRNTGDLPLPKAAARVNPSLVSCLLESGADIHLTQDDGSNALHQALSHEGHYHLYDAWDRNEIVSRLLVHGADVNAQDIQGRTPLHYFARFLNQECWTVSEYQEPLYTLTLLANAGADFQARDKAGLTPIDLAASGADGTFLDWGTVFAVFAAAPLPSTQYKLADEERKEIAELLNRAENSLRFIDEVDRNSIPIERAVENAEIALVRIFILLHRIAGIDLGYVGEDHLDDDSDYPVM